MNNIAISVIGRDCPGVVHAIASSVAKERCEIVELSQSLLMGQFASIVIVAAPDGVSDADLRQAVSREISARGLELTVAARNFDGSEVFSAGEETEPFVVTVTGADTSSILVSMTGLFTENKINIENLRVLQAENGAAESVFVFEISLPLSINRNAFRQMLHAKARQSGLEISIQRQAVFEAIHRVPIV